MSYLLDTCIISRLRKIKTDESPSLKSWILSHAESLYFISVLTFGEIQTGISKLSSTIKEENKKKMTFENWLHGDLIPRFKNRILNFDEQTASIWGTLKGEALKQGINLPVVDSQIAATALQHNLILITENTNDFKYMNVRVINPIVIANEKRKG